MSISLNQSVIDRTYTLTKRLRVSAKASLRQILAPGHVVQEPAIFHAGTYRGEFPMVVFVSYPCSKYLEGKCSPCFYSGLPAMTALKREVYASLPGQLENFLDRFEEHVVNFQPQRGADLPYVIQISGEGSFLADSEIPPEYREQMLELLADFARQRGIRLALNLEAKAEDILRAGERREFESWQRFREDLEFSFALGFEAVNEFVRNVIFAKGLTLEDFEKAVSLVHRHEMDTIAYVYAGGYGMRKSDILEHLRETFAYLRKSNVGIYLMLPNFQPYTIPHILWTYGRAEVLDIPFVYDCIRLLNEHASRNEGVDPWLGVSDWLLGGVTSQPIPDKTVFGEPGQDIDEEGLATFRDMFLELQQTQDFEAFDRQYRSLNLPASEDNDDGTHASDMAQQVWAAVEFAWEKHEDYLELMRSRELVKSGG
jgi:radical SAM enzyme (TIGR01210 family)